MTGDVKYLNLAKFFIDLRGRAETHKLHGAGNQDHKPIVEQDEAVGHAVRAGYFYSGVADVAALTGDAAYAKAIDRIWENVVAKKLYLTGGIGARHAGEAFGENYELPNATAYNETCAAIANALWNERMFLLHGDAKYLDVLERVIYNGFLSGVALTGSEFFYPNPLASGAGYRRSPWFGCACCPVNMVRFLPELAGYFYATRDGEAYVNLFAAGTARLVVARTPVELRQETRYPWDGRVTHHRHAADEGRLRAQRSHSRLGPQRARAQRPLSLRRRSAARGQIGVERPARRVGAAEGLRPHRPHVAGRRPGRAGAADAGAAGGGPCAGEGRRGQVGRRARSAGVLRRRRRQRRQGVGQGAEQGFAVGGCRAARPVGRHRGGENHSGPRGRSGHRNPLLPLGKPRSERDDRVVSHPPGAVGRLLVFPADSVEACFESRTPKSSADPHIPRLTWWDHKGTTEWIDRYFDKPARISSVELYWFDDTGHGGCRVPLSWRLLFKDGQRWQPVEGAGEYGVKRDRFNRVDFTPVTTRGLRLEVRLQPKFSGGILQWKIAATAN